MTPDIDELVRFLTLAIDSYRLMNGNPTSQQHWTNQAEKALAPFKPKLVYVMPEWETLASYPGVSSREILHAGSQLWISEDVYNALREATRVEEK